MNVIQRVWFAIFNPSKLTGGNSLNDKVRARDIYEDSPEDNYLVNIRGSYFSRQGNPIVMENPVDERGEKNKPQQTIKVKPIEVLDELKQPPREWECDGIDDKITILKRKKTLVGQHYVKQDLDGMIQRLENRKKWTEFKSFFSFSTTTAEKVDELCKKYNLAFHPSDIFIPEFPKEAIEVMTSYTENMEKLCGKKPKFYVIATKEMFSDAYKKRDPILLAESPFGLYYDILGAWDKEMTVLSEL
jgi:hypothetical protein